MKKESVAITTDDVQLLLKHLGELKEPTGMQPFVPYPKQRAAAKLFFEKLPAKHKKRAEIYIRTGAGTVRVRKGRPIGGRSMIMEYISDEAFEVWQGIRESRQWQ